MNVFIVYAHPSTKSFTYQVLEQLMEGLKVEKHHVEVSDLYQMNFQSDMTSEEYEREGYANFDLPLSLDVKLEHQKIEKADCVIFLYPLWWSDCPAKLKGWFDRVYSVGYAYGINEDNPAVPMKTINKGIVITTAGHPNDFLDKIGIAESIRNIMLDDRLGNRFKEKELIILGGTSDLNSVKQKHLDHVFEIGKKLNL